MSFETLRKSYSCWQAIGPASKLFEEELAPAAIRYLNSCLVSDMYAVQLSLYMIGKTEDSAAPHLFIICKDKATRRNARELLEESLIMQDERFAGYRLGVSAVAPGEPTLQPFAPVRYTLNRVPSKDMENSSTAVYLPSPSNVIRPGTSIFVLHVVEDSKVQHIKMTVGPVLYSGTKRYFLTAGHPFESSSTKAPSTSIDDLRISDSEDLECDFEGLSDTEEESYDGEVEEMLSIASRSSGDELDDVDASSHSSSSREGTSASTLQSPTASSSNPSNFSFLKTPNDTEPHYPVPVLGPNNIIGKVVLSGSKDGLDYCLVEITNDQILATNRLFPRKISTESPSSFKISSIGSLALNSPVEVLTATSSSGILDGKLDPAPTYIRLPGNKYLEKLYIGHFNGTLEKGDCGAMVVDSRGSFYGHIIGGTPGTGIAYVVSGQSIFTDIETRHPNKVTFSPPPISPVKEPATSASSMTLGHTIVIRRLDRRTSQATLQDMLLFAKDLVDCGTISASKYPEDKGFASATAQFRTLKGALEARGHLNGKRNLSNEATLIVELVQESPPMSNHVTSTFHADPFRATSSATSDSGADESFEPYVQHSTKTSYPPVNPADQNPPCNTLYVGNLPYDTSEDEVKALFSKQRGYKRICFRTKQNGPMCFVEFEDISFATKALNELYGHPLHNSVKGGIRLSFSKNPLGVRTGQSTSIAPTSVAPPATLPAFSSYGFSSLARPPPGLSAPRSLSTSYSNSNSGSNGSMSNALVPQAIQLPAMTSGAPSSTLPGSQSYQQPHQFDRTGQIAPPGMKPRVTATLWEDEGRLCFQVEAKGVCVARREDNHMINGTKLLEVAGMTRGRRDGILKSEKVRHVVKIGPMHLKGVWIPFERALEFANKEKITEQLYPLFVHDIGALLYHPSNQTRASVGGAAMDAVTYFDDRFRMGPAMANAVQSQPLTIGLATSVPSNGFGSVSGDNSTSLTGRFSMNPSKWTVD